MDNSLPTPMTDPQKLRSIMRSMHPVTTEKRLIRMGPAGDGGYLVPDDLEAIEACFSPGVANVSGFERECADRGMAVFMADRAVKQPAEHHPSFNFLEKYVGVTTSKYFITMDAWVNQSLPGSNGDLLLQMDIEGYEYENLLNMSDQLMQRFRIIVIEFHGMQMLYSSPYFFLASRVFSKLTQTHACLHIHPNNCATAVYRMGMAIPRVMEFTFLRRDRFFKTSANHKFPHPLDVDNTGNPTLTLPECWFK